MTQEEKELLIKDLCARLPYGVQCEIGGLRHGPYTFTGSDVEDLFSGRLFKPYLRPMSSMIEEELEECRETCKYRKVGQSVLDCATRETFDFLNAHHLDYRGLIPMGLAIEAPKNMYKL